LLLAIYMYRSMGVVAALSLLAIYRYCHSQNVAIYRYCHSQNVATHVIMCIYIQNINAYTHICSANTHR
jgi:hypothetical protein